MNEEIDPIEENDEYELAKKWLNENGTFTNSVKETRGNKGINAKTEKVIHVIKFQRKGDTEIKTDEGDDLKKLIIGMYRAEI